jgi:pimeloyl-ACP methyl ester carboxylesterase
MKTHHHGKVSKEGTLWRRFLKENNWPISSAKVALHDDYCFQEYMTTWGDMKRIECISMARKMVLAPFVAALLIGCATPPTKISKIERLESHRGDLENDSLGNLLESALANPKSTHYLAHFVARWHRRDRDRSNDLVQVKAIDGQVRRYRVSFDSPRSRYFLKYFDEIGPVSKDKLKRIRHHRRGGVGAPLVALRENKGRDPIEAFYSPEAITRPLTAVITGEFSGDIQRVQIDLICPLHQSQVNINGMSRALAADFSAPLAVQLTRTSGLNRSQLFDFVNSEPRREPRLHLMEPYDPHKEPLIMIHGLLGTPLIWAELSNTLWADDEVQSRYQIWHFLYNTSAPALYSGRVLRNQLREVRSFLDPSGKDPAMQSTTVVAHSMGGIVARTLLTRPGNAFWDAAFHLPFDSLKLSEEDRDSLKGAFFWNSTPHVERVIYIAASHRGSDFADNPIGRLGRLAARPPKSGFKDYYERISQANPGAFTKADQELGQGKLNSIHALSPRQPSLPILASLSNHHSVREFSIIGDQGKPGPLEKSSDGIVPYWSSHIDRAGIGEDRTRVTQRLQPHRNRV